MEQWLQDKSPDDVLDYAVDFTQYLESSEVISTKTITVEEGLTKDSDGLDATSKKVIMWFSSGVAGNTYDVTVEIDSDGSPSKTIKRTVKLQVRSDI